MAGTNNGWTPTEKRLHDALKDGLPHHPDELRLLLGDELSCSANLVMHVSNMRKKLEPKGRDIVCVYSRRQRFYQMVRLLADACDGRS